MGRSPPGRLEENTGPNPSGRMGRIWLREALRARWRRGSPKKGQGDKAGGDTGAEAGNCSES